MVKSLVICSLLVSDSIRLFKVICKDYKNTLNKACIAYNCFDETAQQSYFEKAVTQFVCLKAAKRHKNNQCLMDKRCIWGLSIFLIQNRSIVFGFVLLCRQLILYCSLGFQCIHHHEFECHQKKKKQMKPTSLHYFNWQDEKGDLCFSREWEFFQHDFHDDNLTKNT